MTSQKLNLKQMQIAIFNKANLAYKLLKNCESKNFDTQEEYLMYDVQIESYKMLIINHLYALLGKGNNNKISLNFNHANDLQIFYQKYEAELKTLKNARDKVYSHIDLDFLDNCQIISYEFIEVCLNFINSIFKKEVY